MPKSGKLKKELLQGWLTNLKQLKVIDDNHVFCVICDKKISCDRKSQIEQHLLTKVHKTKKEKVKDNHVQQQLLDTNFAGTTKDEQFRKDLCNLFITCNIPLYKLDNEIFKNFLRKYCTTETNCNIPSSSLLRKKYVDLLYDDVINTVKQALSGKCLWFSVDETTDVQGRYMANLIVGVLDKEIPTKGYLINCKQLEKTNNVTVSRFVNESLTNLFLPERLPADKVLLMVSDAAPYMVKSAGNLKVFYPHLIHCTCLAHGVNRVAEVVRNEFTTVNKLIKCGKKVFLKAPSRIQIFKERLPNLSLPPEPIVTGWGTWLTAAVYYADNYSYFKNVVSQFDAGASAAIKESKELFKDKNLCNELAFIKTHLGSIATTLTKLQCNSLLLSESIDIINTFISEIDGVPGKIGKKIQEKLFDVMHKNEGFNILQNINKILKGEFDIEVNMDPLIISHFRYAPITSCDVERSFSSYKTILNDRRQCLTLENIEKYLICYCNKADGE